MRFKYLIHSLHGAIIFPEAISHAEVARGIDTIFVESGGFCTIQQDSLGGMIQVHHGEVCVSFNDLKPLPFDESVIYDTLHGTRMKYLGYTPKRIREEDALKLAKDTLQYADYNNQTMLNPNIEISFEEKD